MLLHKEQTFAIIYLNVRSPLRYLHKGGKSGGRYRVHKKLNQKNNHRIYKGRKERSNKVHN